VSKVPRRKKRKKTTPEGKGGVAEYDYAEATTREKRGKEEERNTAAVSSRGTAEDGRREKKRRAQPAGVNGFYDRPIDEICSSRSRIGRHAAPFWVPDRRTSASVGRRGGEDVAARALATRSLSLSSGKTTYDGLFVP